MNHVPVSREPRQGVEEQDEFAQPDTYTDGRPISDTDYPGGARKVGELWIDRTSRPEQAWVHHDGSWQLLDAVPLPARKVDTDVR